MSIHDEAQATLTDVSGEPFYISLLPCIANPEKGESDLRPVVIAAVNGRETILSAGEAWRTGIAMFQAATTARYTNGHLMPGIAAGISFGIDDGPVIQITPDTAEEIGMNMVGAAIAACHTRVMWRHATEKLGWPAEQAAGFFSDVDGGDALDCLR